MLTGRVAQRGDAFVVSAELVDVDDGSQLWGTLLNRRRSDVFTLQAEISRELTDALRLRLTREQKKRLTQAPHRERRRRISCICAAAIFSNKRTGHALQEAQRLFERAVGEDPGYALAYAGLADCCSLMAVSLRPSTVGTTDRAGARSRAQGARARRDAWPKAMRRWRSSSSASTGTGRAPKRSSARAIELNPGHAPSRQWHAMFLASRSRFDAALAEMRVALELDPLSLVIQTGIGRILHFAGRFDEAIAQYEHVLQTNPAFGQAHIDLALTRLATSEFATGARRPRSRRSADWAGVSTILLLRGICAVREGLVGRRPPRPRRAARALRARRGRRRRSRAARRDARRLGCGPAVAEARPARGARRSSATSTSSRRWRRCSTTPQSRALLQQHGFDGVP